MSTMNLGNKHACEDCGAKFYDMGQAEAACPKCGTTAAPTDVTKPKTKGTGLRSKTGTKKQGKA